MTPTPPQPASDEADPEKQTTPAGVVRDLEEKAEETGASTEPSPPAPEGSSQTCERCHKGPAS